MLNTAIVAAEEREMSYPEFRSQLDSVLRSKNPEAVRQFLIEQGQWDQDSAGDVEHAMWMMIAGSPTLQHLHVEAQSWLRQHGYQAEAEMLRDRSKAPVKTPSQPPRPKGQARAGKPHTGGKHTVQRAPRHEQ
ncbi:MAG TPA: hypothetical protein VFU69_08015 [Ktedonobacterales bacterium]|nr:hypothetical protein [Ktedonobacterales bacterium]